MTLFFGLFYNYGKGPKFVWLKTFELNSGASTDIKLIRVNFFRIKSTYSLLSIRCRSKWPLSVHKVFVLSFIWNYCEKVKFEPWTPPPMILKNCFKTISKLKIIHSSVKNSWAINNPQKWIISHQRYSFFT